MIRNVFAACVMVLLGLLSPALGVPGGAAAAKPNFIVIMTDDQDDTGSLVTMPWVQQVVVKQGIRYLHSFVNVSLCMPSRPTFFTGQSGHNVKAATYAMFAPREANNLGVWLQKAGYSTALVGKFMNGYGDTNPTHIVPGWNEWSAVAGPPRYYNYDMNENGLIKHYGTSGLDYSTTVLRRKALSFLSRQATAAKPFFMVVATVAPHVAPGVGGNPIAPIPAPRHIGYFANLNMPPRPSFNEADVSDKPGFIATLPPLDATALYQNTYDFRKRRESLMAVDEMVRDMVRSLTPAQLANTFIIITSDNGYSQAAHRIRGKLVLYEESIRVPLVMRGPGIPANEVRGQLVTNLDLPATILDLAGALPGNALDGRSLVPTFTNAAAPWRSAFYYNASQPLPVYSPKPTDSVLIKAVRSRRYIYGKLASGQFGVEEELYDFAVDPYQLVNRARDPKYAAVLGFHRNLLPGLSTCLGANCWVTAVPPPPGN